jgi:uncharacterized protein DUF4350
MTSTAERASATRPPATPAGAGPGPAGGGRGPGPASGLTGWRQWRAPAAVVLLVLLGGLVVALLQVRPPVTGPLDPNDTGPVGAHALVALLQARGQTVTRAGSAGAAAALAGSRSATLVVTSPQELSGQDLAMLARVPAKLLLVAPGRDALDALAPGVTLAGSAAPVRDLPPRCDLPGAVEAGAADLGGLLLRSAPPGAWHCYPPSAGTPPGFSYLLSYEARGHRITVLGTTAPLANDDLGATGNAALALNLLAAGPRIVWLVPGPRPVAVGRPGHQPLTALVPGQVYAVVIQLGVVVLLLALWRARRLGPLVTEPLPVVVRACETVEGHGRLYRSRRARDRAAAALREAALRRIVTRLGLPRGVTADAACQELASRTGRGAGEIRAVLFGPVPGDDAALVQLAADLDALEGQVLTL